MLLSGLSSRFYLLLLLAAGPLLACNEPPPFVYLNDSRPETVINEEHPCVNFDDSEDPELSLYAAVAQHEEGRAFLRWLEMLETAEPRLYNQLKGMVDGSFTLLMPNNEAVHRFEATYPEVLTNQESMLNLIKHHFLLLKVAYRQFSSAGGFQPAMNREPLEYTVTDQYCVLFERRARLIESDDFCENGIIHLIDAVLIPQKGF